MDVHLGPIELAQRDALEASVAEVYASAFAGPPYEEGSSAKGRFLSRWRAQRSMPGWTGVGAWAEGLLVGLAYGHAARRGVPWVDALLAQLTPTGRTKWGEDAFLFCELAVMQDHQGRGVGGRLHDALIQKVGHATALLTTLDDPSTAGARLYRARGWRQVSARPYVAPGYPHHYVVMGLRLDRCG